MRFYCSMTRKPNVVVEQIKHGLQVVSQKKLCTFVDGQLDTEDPHVIKKLKARPDLFWIGREDINYRALDYPQLVYEAERLGIKTYRVSKRDLMKSLIHFERDGTSGKVEVGGRTRNSKSLEEIRMEARQRVKKAQEESALLESIESIDEIEVVVKMQTKENEIAGIEAALQLPSETE